MRLFILRHGIAEDPAATLSDAERPLSERGVRKTRRALHGARRLKMRPDWIITSPLLRAIQTAQLAAEALEIPAERLRESSLLEPEADPTAFARHELAPLEHDAACLIVGHEPHLGRMCSWLMTGVVGGMRLELRKAGLVGMDCEPPLGPGCGTLRFLLQPRHLRGLD